LSKWVYDTTVEDTELDPICEKRGVEDGAKHNGSNSSHDYLCNQ